MANIITEITEMEAIRNNDDTGIKLTVRYKSTEGVGEQHFQIPVADTDDFNEQLQDYFDAHTLVFTFL